MPSFSVFQRPTFLLLLAVFASANAGWSAEPASTKEAQISRGKLLYLGHCVTCHQNAGQGTPGAFPPLAASDFLMADKARSIRIVVEGFSDIIDNQRSHDEGAHLRDFQSGR